RRGKPAQIGLRHVISISHALPGRMGRDHGVAGSIEQDPRQRSVVLGPRRDVMGSLLGQSPLHGLKQLAVDQWRLRARADLTFIENLADVEAIAQEGEEGALRESSSTSRLTLPSARYRLKIMRTSSASCSTMESLPSLSLYPSGTIPPTQSPLRLEAATLSRMRSAVTSRSNCANES